MILDIRPKINIMKMSIALLSDISLVLMPELRDLIYYFPG